MQTDFRLQAVHGMLYTGGNVAFGTAPSTAVSPLSTHTLVSPVLNHLTTLDLQQGTTRTHTCCNSDIVAFDVSPDGAMALAIGSRGLGVFYSFTAELALDTISLPPNASVSCVRFSPDGTHVALALETTLQIYSTPKERTVTFHGVHRVENIHNAMTLPITHLEWTSDSQHVLVAAADAKITIFPRDVRNRKGLAAARNHLIGHRGAVVGAFFSDDAASSVISVSSDNVAVAWRRTKTTRAELMTAVAKTKMIARVRDVDGASDDEDAVPESFLEKQKRFARRKAVEDDTVRAVAGHLSKGSDAHLSDVLRYAFEVKKKHLLQHKGTVSVTRYHHARQLLAIGYANGIFAIHGVNDEELPLLHFLSISSQSLTACAFSTSGDHIAFGSAHLKQLIVWDWRGESFLLKEQSHYYDINCTGMTPDGATIMSGGEDGKVKVWKRSNGQCFANFSDHNGGITGLVTSPATNAFFTASKDGTCRGYDLTRYRCFRVFNPDQATQLSCLSIDPSGELLAAGSSRSNVITIWSTRTGKIVDEFTGHDGPITALQFHPDGTSLVSGAVDKKLMIWQVFTTTEDGERMRHDAETVEVEAEVLSISFAHTGKRMAALMLNGDVSVYDSIVATELNFISSFRTKMDATGGWAEKVGPNSANANAHFTAVSMAPDGETVLLGGESKWLCLYHSAQGYLMNKWAVTCNMEFDGASEQFDYRSVTEAGVMLGSIDVDPDDPHLTQRKLIEMPGSKHRHFATGKRKTKLAARTMHLAFATHGRDFIAATTGGLLVFSVDVSRPKFAPLQLSATVTSGVVRDLLASGEYTTALIGALLLQDEGLGTQVMRSTPSDRIAVAIPSVPTSVFGTLLQWVAHEVMYSRGLQHALAWADALLTATEEPLFGHARAPAVAAAVRLLHRAVAPHKKLAGLTDDNAYLIDYVVRSTKMARAEAVAPRRNNNNAGAAAVANDDDGDDIVEDAAPARAASHSAKPSPRLSASKPAPTTSPKGSPKHGAASAVLSPKAAPTSAKTSPKHTAASKPAGKKASPAMAAAKPPAAGKKASPAAAAAAAKRPTSAPASAKTSPKHAPAAAKVAAAAVKATAAKKPAGGGAAAKKASSKK